MASTCVRHMVWVTVLVGTWAGLLVFVLRIGGEKGGNEGEMRMIIAAVVSLSLGFGVALRDEWLGQGVFWYPHPWFWQLVTACAFLYLSFVCYLFLLPIGRARQVMALLDPIYGGKPLLEKSYAESCEFRLSKVWDSLDIFIVAHTLGWLFKSVMIRDRFMLWIASVSFELLECSLQRILPNFAECWWDRWIMDVLVCNWIGIELGAFLVHYVLREPFHWISIRSKDNRSGIHKEEGRSSMSMNSRSWLLDYRWLVLEDRRRFFQALLLLVMVESVDINAFFLKAVLRVDVPSKLNIYRLVVIGMTGLPAVRELYRCSSVPGAYTKYGLGLHVWLLAATLAVELAFTTKHFTTSFPNAGANSFPKSTRILWTLFSFGLVSFLAAFPFHKSLRKGFKTS